MFKKISIIAKSIFIKEPTNTEENIKDIFNEFVALLTSEEFDEIKNFIQTNHLLLNDWFEFNLNTDEEEKSLTNSSNKISFLSLAVKKKHIKTIQFLLPLAKLSHVENMYCNKNSSLITQYQTLSSLLKSKIENLITFFQSENSQIAELINEQLLCYNYSESNLIEKIDLYDTLFSIQQMILTENELDYPTYLKTFLIIREQNIFKTPLDYLFINNLCNQICFNLAAYYFEEEPFNTLLYNTKENRNEPWINLNSFELKSDLVVEDIDYTLSNQHSEEDNPFYYFRGSDNRIHCILQIVQRAITRINSQHYNLNEIWLGTDLKTNPNYPAKHGSDIPLSTFDLQVLKQLSSSLCELITYTEHLEKNYNFKNNSAYAHLCELRNGLLEGDARHTGEELIAGTPTYIATATFFEWFNQLSEKSQKIITNNSNINNCIQQLTNNTKNREETKLCVSIIGGRLEKELLKPQLAHRLKQIFDESPENNQQNFTYYSEEKLSQLEKNIPEELLRKGSLIILNYPIDYKLILALYKSENDLISTLKFDFLLENIKNKKLSIIDPSPSYDLIKDDASWNILIRKNVSPILLCKLFLSFPELIDLSETYQKINNYRNDLSIVPSYQATIKHCAHKNHIKNIILFTNTLKYISQKSLDNHIIDLSQLKTLDNKDFISLMNLLEESNYLLITKSLISYLKEGAPRLNELIFDNKDNIEHNNILSKIAHLISSSSESWWSKYKANRNINRLIIENNIHEQEEKKEEDLIITTSPLYPKNDIENPVSIASISIFTNNTSNALVKPKAMSTNEYNSKVERIINGGLCLSILSFIFLYLLDTGIKSLIYSTHDSTKDSWQEHDCFNNFGVLNKTSCSYLANEDEDNCLSILDNECKEICNDLNDSCDHREGFLAALLIVEIIMFIKYLSMLCATIGEYNNLEKGNPHSSIQGLFTKSKNNTKLDSEDLPLEKKEISVGLKLRANNRGI